MTETMNDERGTMNSGAKREFSSVHHSSFIVHRSGMALVVVLIVVAVLSLAGYTFAELMFSEFQAADAHGREPQVVFVGRQEPRKGLHVLLRAWPEVRQRTGSRLSPRLR